MLLVLELEMKKNKVSENLAAWFLVSPAKNYSARFNERDLIWSHLFISILLERWSLTHKLVPMFQHGRRLMVDQCTTCDCFQSAPRKYTLRCTKLNCQACPAVSGNSLGRSAWNVSDESHVLWYTHHFTSGTALGLLAFLQVLLGSLALCSFHEVDDMHQIWSKSSV